MRIVVRTEQGRALTYEAPDDTRVGDEVRLPAARGWADIFPSRWATVEELGSDYTGPAVSVLERRRA